ncbi:hypothetical protein [Elioraea sp.]|jgi:hypothetical protein|uniref:hypothetical protein n=1 Tax=Elioraea sp. TaxID=2185103 RepID=UPI0021DBFF53|nr:hypothetical protein [Elioraea sp.]GIX11609.1 MAG: hypothetical protein KatS3mg116_3319 [Elioraea sp.]
MSTPNLAIPHVAAAQAQKEVTINDGFDGLDRAVTDFLTVNLSSGDVTLTDAQYRGHRIFRSQGVTVARTLTVPAIRREVAIDNADGTAVLTVARGAGFVDIPPGAALVIYTDGTTNGIRPIGGVGGGGGAADFLDLSDTPSSYAGHSLKPVRVNVGETGLEFFTPGLSAGNWAVPFRGALVRRTSDATGLTFPWFASWQTAVYDTDSFWDSGTPTRLTIPAGITRVRLHGSVRLADQLAAGSIFLALARNGTFPGPSSYPGTEALHVRHSGTGFNTNQAFFITPVLSVSAGDYFELRLNRTGLTVTSVLADPATFFAIEVVEVSTAQQAPSIAGARGLNSWGGTAGGTANARTVSLTPALTAYFAGLAVRFINGAAANTGAATLNVDGLGAVAIRKGDGTVDLAAGDLPASALVTVVHDGTVFRLA